MESAYELEVETKFAENEATCEGSAEDAVDTEVSPKATILSLPPEVLEIILENEDLGMSDIVSFGLSCRQLYQVVFYSKKLWKLKIQAWKKEKRIRKFMKLLNPMLPQSKVLDMYMGFMQLNNSTTDSDFDSRSYYSLPDPRASSESELSDCFLE